jgi:hypothetical protein
MMGQACGKKHPALSAFSVNGNKWAVFTK